MVPTSPVGMHLGEAAGPGSDFGSFGGADPRGVGCGPQVRAGVAVAIIPAVAL